MVNLHSVTFPVHLAYHTFLCFGKVSYGRKSAVNHSCFSLLRITAPTPCGYRPLWGRKEQNKKSSVFEEVSISSQGVERLYIEIQPSCFSVLIHSAVQKQTPLWWRAVTKPNAGGILGDRETQDRDKRKQDEKKEGEKQLLRAHIWRKRIRTDTERHKRWRRGHGHEGQQMFPSWILLPTYYQSCVNCDIGHSVQSHC